MKWGGETPSSLSVLPEVLSRFNGSMYAHKRLTVEAKGISISGSDKGEKEEEKAEEEEEMDEGHDASFKWCQRIVQRTSFLHVVSYIWWKWFGYSDFKLEGQLGAELGSISNIVIPCQLGPKRNNATNFWQFCWKKSMIFSPLMALIYHHVFLIFVMFSFSLRCLSSAVILLALFIIMPNYLVSFFLQR